MTTLDIVFVLGRLLFGGFFLISAYNHLVNGKQMVGYAAAKGVPAPTLAVYGTGVLLLVGSLSVIVGLVPRIGLALLGVFLLGVTPKMHDFWNHEDPMAKMGELVNFQKNIALLGAALALFVVSTPWPYAVTL